MQTRWGRRGAKRHHSRRVPSSAHRTVMVQATSAWMLSPREATHRQSGHPPSRRLPPKAGQQRARAGRWLFFRATVRSDRRKTLRRRPPRRSPGQTRPPRRDAVGHAAARSARGRAVPPASLRNFRRRASASAAGASNSRTSCPGACAFPTDRDPGFEACSSDSLTCRMNLRSCSSSSLSCASRGMAGAGARGSDTEVPHRWQCVSVTLLTAPHLHSTRCSGDPQSLQYFAPAGFSRLQKGQLSGGIGATCPAVRPSSPFYSTAVAISVCRRSTTICFHDLRRARGVSSCVAASLGLAQSALSRQVSALEREVGAGEFVRSGRWAGSMPVQRAG